MKVMKTRIMSGAFSASIKSEGSAHYLKLQMYNSIDAAVATTVTYNLVAVNDLDLMIKELQEARRKLWDIIVIDWFSEHLGADAEDLADAFDITGSEAIEHTEDLMAQGRLAFNDE